MTGLFGAVEQGLLQCPVCGGELAASGAAIACPSRHSFDVAREGYVSLLGGAGSKLTGDTAAMLAARAAFLETGHFRPIVDALIAAVRQPSAVLEIGAGTGYYLGRLLDASPESIGVGFDISKPACKRIAKSHERVASVLADAWASWPFADGRFSHVISVFAPRNAAEIDRVLAPEGRYVVVMPTAGHLFGLLDRVKVGVDDNKDQRLDDALGASFERQSVATVEYPVTLTAAEAGEVIAMGPNGHHLDDTAKRVFIAGLPDDVATTVSVTVSVYRPVRFTDR